MSSERRLLPHFFIVGAPRCGTTALWSYLRQHPQLFMSHPKEPHFFARDFPSTQITTDWAQYVDLFRPAPPRATFGEASVWYLYSDVAVSCIAREIPDAKIIAMLRNPIDAAASLHAYKLLRLDEIETDFGRAWDLGAARARGLHVPKACREPRQLLYRQVYTYGPQIRRLFNCVPHNNVLTVIFEDFIVAPRTEYAKILQFLGVPDDGRAEFPAAAQNKRRVDSLRDMGIRRLVERRRHGSRVLQQIDAIARGLLGVPRWRRMRKNVTKPAVKVEGRKSLERHVRERLLADMEDDIADVEALVGRGLSVWRNVEDWEPVA